MKQKNQLLIASAGSGKTYTLVKKALEVSFSGTKKILITTYTDENTQNIKYEILKQNHGIIPTNLIVLPWFSFLLHELVRPFQGCMQEELWDKKIGFNFVTNPPSAKKVGRDGKPLLIPGTKFPQTRSEEDYFIRHYFTKKYDIFSDKIAKFSYKCNEKNNGKSIFRLQNIYSHIFIDEVQDLAGYDLNIIKSLLQSTAWLFMVGDPRQSVFVTNHSRKNKKFKGSEIQNFFETDQFEDLLETLTLNNNRRSNSTICNYSNKLYPSLSQTISVNNTETEHDGMFFIKPNQLELYFKQYPKCVQLRRDKRTCGLKGYSIINFGQAKGCSFDRVLIYPTPKMIERIKDNNINISNMIRAKLYVAITRARYSIAIVSKHDHNIEGIQKFE